VRLGLVIYGSLDTISGGYLYDRKLVEYLRQNGDSVEIISMPWQNYAGHLRHNFQQAWEERLGGLDVDVLLQDELNHPSLYRMNRRLRSRGQFPLISIVHHLRSSEQHPPLWLGLYRNVERAYLRTLDGFIFNSQTTRVAVQHMLGVSAADEPRHVVATPAGDRFGRLDAEQITKRVRWGGPLRLLFVGNLIRRKGLHILLDALGRIPRADVRLEVVGRGDVDTAYSHEVISLVARKQLWEKVRFLGPIADEKLIECLQQDHLLVMPSSYEGFGIVYLEGMAYGLPPVGTTSGAASEIIQNDINGLIIPPDNPARLAAEIERLCEDREWLLELSLAARRRFDDFPGWGESMRRARELIETVIAAG
jgi:glycosyltransferase involved in cell wall biosynthesis